MRTTAEIIALDAQQSTPDIAQSNARFVCLVADCRTESQVDKRDPSHHANMQNIIL